MAKVGIFAGLVPIALGGYRILANATFTPTISLGVLLVGLLIIIISGLFTVRANVAKVWRENYEGEKERARIVTEELKRTVESSETLLKQTIEAKNAELTIERETKHQAITDLNAMRLKTDQTTVLKQLTAMQAEAASTAAESVHAVQQLIAQVANIASTMAGVALTVQGLVEATEKMNRRLDDLERERHQP